MAAIMEKGCAMVLGRNRVIIGSSHGLEGVDGQLEPAQGAVIRSHLAGDHHAVRVGRRGLVTKFQYFVNIITFHDMESSYKVSLEELRGEVA